jgi:futalosine hydrolase
MRILIVAATELEIQPTIDYLNQVASSNRLPEFFLHDKVISYVVTGVGQVATSFFTAQFIHKFKPDLTINAGIAGCFHRHVVLGTVFKVEKDRFADVGVELVDGSFQDVFDMKLANKDEFPFSDGWLVAECPYLFAENLTAVTSITVNKVTGTDRSIQLIREQFNPDLETMEGAGFIYTCKMMDIPCLQIRSISNYVEPRNKDNWQMAKAIKALNDVLIQYLKEKWH